ncbi:MAG: twin-arginine translocase subunit TatC [bacterium]|nr:twin-arginine translocase subunit TatC [bacterium]
MKEELKILFKGIGYFCIALLLVGGLLFSFGIDGARIGNTNIPVPVLRRPSVTALVFKKIADDLVPDNVILAASSPISAFSTQLLLSFFLAFILILPFSLVAFARYISRALAPTEKLILYIIILPVLILFISGVLFAYKILLPFMLSALALHAESIGVPSYFFLSDFVTLTLAMLFGTGLLFLIPVVMPVLTFARVIRARAWLHHWRASIMVSLVLSAIVANDGSGISMLLLALPLVLCYFGGIVVSLIVERFVLHS